MIDCFALFGETRRPWMDIEKLKEKFLALSTQTHPDRFHSASPREKEAASARWSELNAAHTCLREPKDRLAHLLALELGRRPADIQSVSGTTSKLFFEIGQFCREVDEFLKGRTPAASPLMQVQSLQRSLELSERVAALRERVEEARRELDQELKELDAVWMAAPPAGSPARVEQLVRIEELYRAYSYVARWRAQLQERFVRLAI